VRVGQAMAVVQRDLGRTEQDLAASQERMAPVGSWFPPDAGADWCIDFVATRPEYRRRGLVDALPREAVRCGAGADFDFWGKRCGAGGYEKVGFAVHDESCSPEFEAALGSPGFRRLMRRL
jgi:GNAT superfamily N-acetyltransferase